MANKVAYLPPERGTIRSHTRTCPDLSAVDIRNIFSVIRKRAAAMWLWLPVL